MHHIGIDIIEISRIEKAIIRWGQGFLRRIYTDPEIKLCQKRSSSLAARFAAKEAVMKALGTGRKGVSWREIEVLSERSGKPLVRLQGRAQDKATSLGLNNLDICLSHSKEYAVAFVVGEAKWKTYLNEVS
jgi:holo-[acyl-carrier-protein] synthase